MPGPERSPAPSLAPSKGGSAPARHIASPSRSRQDACRNEVSECLTPVPCGSPAPARSRFATRRSCPAAGRGGGRDAVQRHQPRHRGAGAPRRRARRPSATRMRAPLQAGDFPFPVKYGYAAVGRVVAGPAGRSPGATSSCCIRTRTASRRRRRWRCRCRDGVPAGRAVLAANMETALNVVWDAGAAPGDRIAVVGAGVVGALVGLALRAAAGDRGDARRRRTRRGRRWPRRSAAASPLPGGGAGGLRRRRSTPAPAATGLATALGGGGARGDGGRGELVRRPAVARRPRRRVPQPAAPARRRARSGWSRPGGGPAGPTAGGSRRRWGFSPTRRSTR